MHRSFILRGALGFLIGGVFFIEIQSRHDSLPGGIWTAVALACAVFGVASAFALEGLHDDETRPLKRWSAAGWIVGGFLFCAVFRVLITRASPTVVIVLPAMFAGLCGGIGLGLGWRGLKTALLLGVASAILLPASLWLNAFIIKHAGLWLIKLAPMSVSWIKLCAWAFGLVGFVIYGALMGWILALHEDTIEPEPLLSRPAPSSGAQRITERAATVAAGFQGRSRGEPSVIKGAAAPPELNEMFVDSCTVQREDELGLDESVAITPFEDENPRAEDPGRRRPITARPAADLSPSRFEKETQTPPDLASEGTFRASRRNFHPDFAPEARPETKGGGSNEIKILRNYHPDFAPPTGPALSGDKPQAPPEKANDPLEIELEPDENDTADDWDDDGELDYLR